MLDENVQEQINQSKEGAEESKTMDGEVEKKKQFN
jgi:hypothetical protein